MDLSIAISCCLSTVMCICACIYRYTHMRLHMPGRDGDLSISLSPCLIFIIGISPPPSHLSRSSSVARYPAFSRTPLSHSRRGVILGRADRLSNGEPLAVAQNVFLFSVPRSLPMSSFESTGRLRTSTACLHVWCASQHEERAFHQDPKSHVAGTRYTIQSIFRSVGSAVDGPVYRQVGKLTGRKSKASA